jgi:hypothetical protein
MADRIAFGMIDTAKQPGTYGGEKISWWSELRRIEKEFLKTDADSGKPAGRLSEAAAAWIRGADLNEVTDYARPQLERMKREADRLVWRPEQPGGVTVVRPGHASLPVFINPDGWLTNDATIVGQPQIKPLLGGVYGLQEAIRRQLRISRSSLDSVLNMSPDIKAKMVDKLAATANMARDVPPGGAINGLTTAETLELRSSSFTNLLAIAVSLDRNTHGRVIDRVHNLCLEMAEQEPDRWLKEHMLKMLNHPMYQEKLTENQKVDALDAFKEARRTKFEVKNITDAQGYVRWEHVCGEGENFFESYKYTMQRQDIHGAKFKVVPGSENFSSYDLICEFNPPRNVDGQEIKGIKMHCRRFENDMFDAIGKNIGTPERPVYSGLSYGGHSQIGENQERSLKNAIAEGKKATTPQIALLDLCAGLDNFNADIKALGDVDLMTTHDSSYFSKGDVRDANGQVVVRDGVTRSEGQDLLVQTLESLTAGENYEKLHARFEDVIPDWQHAAGPNTHPPIFPNFRDVLWFHTDYDDDGVMDARDVHFHCMLKPVAEDKEHEFSLKALPEGMRSDLIRGTAAMNAVLDLNVATHYQANIHHNQAALHKFVADGFFDGEGQKDLIRFNTEEMYNGTKGILVQYNSGLAHTTREALEGLTMYMSMMWLADRPAGAQPAVTGLNEVDRKLMALTFAVFRLNYDGEGNWNDERIWKQLLQVLRLPANMPYGDLQRILDAEHHDYSGNIAVVNQYKERLRQIDPTILQKLEDRNVGRPIGDPPAQPAPPAAPNIG